MITATRSVKAHMDEDQAMASAVFRAIHRFLLDDWGELTEHDKKLNKEITKSRDGMVQGKYKTPQGNIYIEKVFDEPSIERDAITVMFCSEH